MRIALVAFLLIASLWSVQTQTREFFAAANGTPAGVGSLEQPWDLRTALRQLLPPGSKLWLRGGIYPGTFVSTLTGTPEAPIVVRNYQGERVTLDNSTDCTGYLIEGDYTWYWGLELTSSGTKRRTPYADSDCNNTGLSVHLDRGLAFRIQGRGTKLINNIIHDTQQGVSHWGTWTSDPDLEVYGNLIYYNGWEQTPDATAGTQARGHGHGTYTLSKSNGPTKILDNVIHSNFSQGIRMGDEGVFNPTVEGNIVYVNGEHILPMGGRNLYVGGSNERDYPNNAPGPYVPMTGAIIKDNVTYYRRHPGPWIPGNAGNNEGANLGLWWARASGVVLGNYIAGFGGGHALQLGYVNSNATGGTFVASTCTANTIIGTVASYVQTQCLASSNTYHTSSPPTTNTVVLRANAYEPGRAHIAIFNWQGLATVSVDFTAATLKPGQSFEVRDAMNFYGPPVAAGVYSRTGPSVSVPMQGLTRAPMGGEADVSPAYRPKPHTSPEFGAFVVVPGPVTADPVDSELLAKAQDVLEAVKSRQ